MSVRVNVHVYILCVSMSGMCVLCVVGESMHTCVCTYYNNGCAALCVSLCVVYV